MTQTRFSKRQQGEKTTWLKKSKTWEEYLKNIYYDPAHPGSFQGPDKLYDAVKKEDLFSISKQQIKQWLQNQVSFSVNKPVNRTFKRARVIVEGQYDQFDADLIVALDYAHANNGIKYMLVVIDVFSKYAWVTPLKNKTGVLVKQAFRKIFAQGRKPNRIRTDRGSEFTNKVIKEYFIKEKIFHFFTNNEVQANYAERFIKTFKSRMRRYMTQNKTQKYVDVISALVRSYNNTRHKTINMSPVDVNKKNEKSLWWEMYWPQDEYSKEEKRKAKRKVTFVFQVGDLVRMSRTRKTLQREYDDRWTQEVFKIKGRYVRQNIPVYKLQDFDGEELYGTFYQSELQKVTTHESKLFIVDQILNKRRTRDGVKQVFVSWKGWPNKFNKWVNEDNIHNNE
jgi:hypothetical protein